MLSPKCLPSRRAGTRADSSALFDIVKNKNRAVVPWRCSRTDGVHTCTSEKGNEAYTSIRRTRMNNSLLFPDPVHGRRTRNAGKARGTWSGRTPPRDAFFEFPVKVPVTRELAKRAFWVDRPPVVGRLGGRVAFQRAGQILRSASARSRMAGGLGFEPRQAESESAVLPLDDPPTGAFCPVGQPV